MSLNDKLHEHTKCVKERSNAHDNDQNCEQPARNRKRMSRDAYGRHHIYGGEERINEGKMLDQYIPHNPQCKHTKHKRDCNPEMTYRCLLIHETVPIKHLLP